MGKFHAQHAAALGLEVLSFDPSLGHGPTDLSRIADRSDWAIVASPTATHALMAAPFIRRGTPTLIEKPVSMNLFEAYWLRHLADQYCIEVFVGYLNRFNGAWRAIKDDLVHSGGGRFEVYRSGRAVGSEYGDAEINLMTHDIDLVLSLWPDAEFHRVKPGEYLVFAKPGYSDIVGTLRADYEANENVRIWQYTSLQTGEVLTADLTYQTLQDRDSNIWIPTTDQVRLQLKSFISGGAELATIDDAIRNIEVILPDVEYVRL